MTHIDRDREDVKIEAMQEASAAGSIGILFLMVVGFVGFFFFLCFRSGTEFWRIYTGVLGLIGIVLTGIAIRGRRLNS